MLVIRVLWQWDAFERNFYVAMGSCFHLKVISLWFCVWWFCVRLRLEMCPRRGCTSTRRGCVKAAAPTLVPEGQRPHVLRTFMPFISSHSRRLSGFNYCCVYAFLLVRYKMFVSHLYDELPRLVNSPRAAQTCILLVLSSWFFKWKTTISLHFNCSGIFWERSLITVRIIANIF